MSAQYSNSARETSGEDARTLQKDAGPDKEDTRSRRWTPDPTRPPMDAAQDTKTVSTKKLFFHRIGGHFRGVRYTWERVIPR